MEIVFIVGCARSGTSIFGELFESHPNIMYVFEERIWRTLGEIDHHAVTPEDIPSKNMVKLRKWMKMYKRKNKIVVEKNPRHIVRVPFIKHIFPDAKILHIVRDGRDVACSLKSGLCGKTWAHVRPPRWREIERDYEGVIRCAHAYHDIMQYPMRDLENIEHMQVKYEDLVANPRDIAHQVFDYIGLPVRPRVLAQADKIQDEMEGSYVAYHQRRWYKTDHSKRIGRWKENMTEEEQVEVGKILKPVLEYYGYE